MTFPRADNYPDDHLEREPGISAGGDVASDQQRLIADLNMQVRDLRMEVAELDEELMTTGTTDELRLSEARAELVELRKRIHELDPAPVAEQKRGAFVEALFSAWDFMTENPVVVFPMLFFVFAMTIFWWLASPEPVTEEQTQRVRAAIGLEVMEKMSGAMMQDTHSLQDEIAHELMPDAPRGGR